MKRNIAVLGLALFFLAGVAVQAEMAKQGEGTYKGYWNFSATRLPMEKERLEIQFDIAGVIEAPDNSPLHNTTAYALETIHAVKGVYQGRGFLRFTRPDGDLIFGTFETSGNLITGERKGQVTFVGGTGKCSGITGTAVMNGGPRLRPGHEKFAQSTSLAKFNWKIP